jgi:hypothetical protein
LDTNASGPTKQGHAVDLSLPHFDDMVNIPFSQDLSGEFVLGADTSLPINHSLQMKLRSIRYLWVEINQLLRDGDFFGRCIRP